ncbi:M43 family zinc metalloprotease [Aurantibacillus circumpalustris]|uniref:M43 family zinc metalloprotease n=1 Tax=Aurantibacillus circumpalustris TaxID=3036359 RepID=UPI00295B6460|nr:M43 family zinc metalloprotease [Aurantibacillus circumpalustris]
MKKQLTKISTLALTLLSFVAFSQEKVQPCNTYEAMEQHFANDPQARKNYEAAQEELRMQLENPVSKSTAAFEYTIPVVFHVIYDCNGVTITDAALQQVLQDVNNDFARKSPDTNLVDQPFRSSYINSDIKFMFATKDPNGNCINGIVRHYDPERSKWEQTKASGFLSSNYWAYTWNPTKYLNIYVVADIAPQGTVTGGGIIVGYTYRPGTWPTYDNHDAIIYNVNYLTGSSGGIPKSRSLTHEIGHWLSLAHTFGNTNNPGVTCSDDGITDTPVTRGEFGGCTPSAPCTQTNPAMAGLNNIQNIMNYSDCSRNFTSGQTTNMRNSLASSVSGRDNLSTLPNLALTNVDGTGLCSPVAEFYATNCTFTVCSGSSLTFKNYSYNGAITSMQWAADNGAIVASPNASLTVVQFPNVGSTNVTFTVSNGQGFDIKNKTITVVDKTAAFFPMSMESFENPGLPANWAITNVENDATTWIQTNDAAYDQITSYRIEGSNNQPNNTDMLQMPVMDVLNSPNDVLEFAYAYRQYVLNQNDVLKIEGSKDCGGTWQNIYALNANYMQNGSGGVSTDYFIPAEYEWKTYVISSHPNWQSYKTSSNVMVRFSFIEGTNGFGNNIYIDAIKWTSLVGVNQLTKSIRFNLFPNPSNGEANVSFTLSDPATVKVSVLDITGREVLPVVENNYNPGEQTITINKNNTLSKGVYFVNLTHNGAKMSHKLIID